MSDPYEWHIAQDGEGFFIEDEYGDSQSGNFGSRFKAEQYLAVLIDNYELPSPPGWEGGFAENH